MAMRDDDLATTRRVDQFSSAEFALQRIAAHIAERLAQGKQISILTVGRKGRDQLRRAHGERFVDTLEAGAVAALATAQAVADIIIKRFEAGEADVVTLFFNRFASMVSQVPTRQQLIPARVEGAAPTIDLKGSAYEYEPDEATILEQLLPQNITIQLLTALLENDAGFYAAQMTAMDNATRNAGDLINALTIQMNRTRQAKITTELIEIISGASAL